MSRDGQVRGQRPGGGPRKGSQALQESVASSGQQRSPCALSSQDWTSAVCAGWSGTEQQGGGFYLKMESTSEKVCLED